MKRTVMHHINGKINDNRPENLAFVPLSEEVQSTYKVIKPKRKSNLAKVLYRHTADGMIQIVGLEGFLTMDEIEEKYGEKVRKIYENPVTIKNPNRNYMRREDTLEGMICFWNESPIYVKGEYTEKEFRDIISIMKLCGKRLSKIVKQVRSQKDDVRVIEI